MFSTEHVRHIYSYSLKRAIESTIATIIKVIKVAFELDRERTTSAFCLNRIENGITENRKNKPKTPSITGTTTGLTGKNKLAI